MTQQYVAGELSLLLGDLCSTLTKPGAEDVAVLRHAVEVGPRSTLAWAAMHALELADHACWASLSQGDVVAFVRQAETCADLWEFGVCAGLIPS